jgi:hypothetical protein
MSSSGSVRLRYEICLEFWGNAKGATKREGAHLVTKKDGISRDYSQNFTICKKTGDYSNWRPAIQTIFSKIKNVNSFKHFEYKLK